MARQDVHSGHAGIASRRPDGSRPQEVLRASIRRFVSARAFRSPRHAATASGCPRLPSSRTRGGSGGRRFGFDHSACASRGRASAIACGRGDHPYAPEFAAASVGLLPRQLARERRRQHPHLRRLPVPRERRRHKFSPPRAGGLSHGRRRRGVLRDRDGDSSGRELVDRGQSASRRSNRRGRFGSAAVAKTVIERSNRSAKARSLSRVWLARCSRCPDRSTSALSGASPGTATGWLRPLG
jgi:hypothetical protein